MQLIGQAGRTIDYDFWVKYLLHTIDEKPDEHYVVHDVRFQNEVVALHNNGFKIYYLIVDEEERQRRHLLREGCLIPVHILNDVSEIDLDDPIPPEVSSCLVEITQHMYGYTLEGFKTLVQRLADPN